MIAASRRIAPLVGLGCAVIGGGGCLSRPERIEQAEVDPPAASQAAIEQYDTDGDGLLGSGELDAFPVARQNRQRYDGDGDGQISAAELEDRLTVIFDPQVALTTGICVVTMAGQPLEGATVRFVPEAFLGDALPAAAGTTDARGEAVLSLSAEDLPEGAPQVSGLIRPGLYRVEITHPGREIPARYNRETTLGQEVSEETVRGGPFRFALDG